MSRYINNTGLLFWLKEKRRWYRDYSKFRKEAKRRFAIERPENGSYQDYLKALVSHRFSYDEYMRYEMWKLTPAERAEFVSMAEMEQVYRKTRSPQVRSILDNKVRTLEVFRDYVYRRWLYVPNTTMEEVRSLMSSTDCVAKPVKGHSGSGIRKIHRIADTDWEKLYHDLLSEQVLIEECIHACNELESFHPASLNTIRVVTISNETETRVIGAILRMGVGDGFIDNTHAGGLFAQIDVGTGEIMSDGVNTDGRHWTSHPDTGKMIKGVKVPFWNKVIATCKDASKLLSGMCFAGWDLCVHEDGKIEIIEVNASPHFDGGMQLPLKKGMRGLVKKDLMELYGIKNIL